MNIRFNYLYRDAGNYKEFGSVVFIAGKEINLSEVELAIRGALIAGEFFVASNVQLPDLHSSDWDSELDHSWHEFGGLEFTNEPCDDPAQRDISAFISSLKSSGN